MTDALRRLPSPWHVNKVMSGYVVRDANGLAIAFVFHRPTVAEALQAGVLTPDEIPTITEAQAAVLTQDEAQQIAVNIASLPELLSRRPN
jgi:hypothetical protein